MLWPPCSYHLSQYCFGTCCTGKGIFFHPDKGILQRKLNNAFWKRKSNVSLESTNRSRASIMKFHELTEKRFNNLNCISG